MSTWIGSVWRTVVSAVAWSAETSAPVVTVDTSARPLIGLLACARFIPAGVVQAKLRLKLAASLRMGEQAAAQSPAGV